MSDHVLCEDCIYCATDVGNVNHLDCRIDPPKPSGTNAMGTFPRVKKGMWCGKGEGRGRFGGNVKPRAEKPAEPEVVETEGAIDMPPEGVDLTMLTRGELFDRAKALGITSKDRPVTMKNADLITLIIDAEADAKLAP